MERSFKGWDILKIKNLCVLEVVFKLLSLGQDHVTLMEFVPGIHIYSRLSR